MHLKPFVMAALLITEMPLFLWSESNNAGQKDDLKIVWEKPFGGDENDMALDVSVLNDGSYVVVGETRSFGKGKTDVCVIKLDGNGTIQWQKDFGGLQRDEAKAVVQSSDGNVVIAGTTKSFSENGDANVYVIKIDTNGKSLFQKMYGGVAKDEANALLALDEGSVLVAGSTKSFGSGSYDGYLLKLDANGKVLWEKVYGGKHAEHLNAIAAAKDGGFFLVGSTESSGEGESDDYLVKIDRNGNELWHETFGESKADVLHAIAVTEDGGCYVAGKTRSYGSKKTDLDIFRLNEHGRVVWHKVIGFKNHEYANALSLSKKGVMVAGLTQSMGHGRADFYLLELDHSGNIIWGNVYGGKKYDIAHAIKPTKENGFIVVGESESYGSGESDFYMMKLKSEN